MVLTKLPVGNYASYLQQNPLVSRFALPFTNNPWYKNFMIEKVIAYLDANQEKFVAELQEYVSFPSVSTDPAYTQQVRACAEWLVNHFRTLGLSSVLHETHGHPVVLARTFKSEKPKRPHIVVYGHYDVQPPDPLDKWVTPPFQATIRDGHFYGRGTADNKGQHFVHIKAVEAYLKTDTDLPCDITFVIEGEEETGSTGFASWLKENAASLHCDAIVISDTSMPAPDKPALTYSIRGLVNFEILVEGPGTDLHSGVYGGIVDNPIIVLCKLLAAVHDKSGRIRIPTFYNDVKPITAKQKSILSKGSIPAKQLKKILGVRAFGGEKGFTLEERRTSRPTFEINGIWGGYIGQGSKTIIPSKAGAKISCRLVPNQDPHRVYNAVKKFLTSLAPETVTLRFQYGAGCKAYMLDPDTELAKAALTALQRAFNKKPLLIKEGGSIPIVSEMTRLLKADAIMIGFALPDAQIHAPNERLDLECFRKGQYTSAFLWQLLPKACK